MTTGKRAWLALGLAAIGTAFAVRLLVPQGQGESAPAVAPRIDPAWTQVIQPLLERRCTVCHGCYDSPCQLNLQSFDGLDRGANPKPIYDPTRVEAAQPTRMFVDAQSTEAWRELFGFFPVIHRLSPESGDPASSLLFGMIDWRRGHSQGGNFDTDAEQRCPGSGISLNEMLEQRPERGMPFGFPPLTDKEQEDIRAWILRGAGRDPLEAPSSEAQAEIGRWELFLNDPNPRSRLVARYVYEHLYLAHLRLSSDPGRWYEVVRSRSAAPHPIDVIASTRPFDDPGTPTFAYRLRPLRQSVVLKTHIPYALDDAKLARLKQIFLDVAWPEMAPPFPSYAPEIAANPFVAFKAIPAAARYQFMLDDALYHVKAFIHGPVCKGQVALNVIDEHFLIFFLSPRADASLLYPAFLQHVGPRLAIPAEGADGVEGIYERFKVDELEYLRAQDALASAEHLSGRRLADIWDGDGNNRGAVLTVYRHFDSAYVVPGAVGGVPKTAWVLDYPIFERMYYDLVAGFNVFGNVIHQVSTRRYMNLLRLEAESSFLQFLPKSARGPLREEWYRPRGVSLLVSLEDPFDRGPEPAIAWADPAHAKEELIRRWLSGPLAPVAAPLEPVQWRDLPLTGDDPATRFARAARTFTARQGPFVQAFPDSALIRLEVPGDEDRVYTLIRNRSHLNIDFMFAEKDALVPAEDTLHVVEGVATSRPNLFLALRVADTDAFSLDLLSLKLGDDSWKRFLGRYGLLRSSTRVWEASDFFNDHLRRTDPFGAGIIDLTRFANDP